MPRHYKRKTQDYQLESLKNAVEAVRNNKLTLSKAADTYSVPRTTIFDYLKEDIVRRRKRGRVHVFSVTQENRIEEHLLKCKQLFHTLTPRIVRKLAFEFAEANKLRHNFDKKSQMAGKDWYYGFMKRHRNVIVERKLVVPDEFDETVVFKFIDDLMAQEISQYVENDTESSNTSQVKRKSDKGQEKRIKIRTQGRNTAKRRYDELMDGDKTISNFEEMAPGLYDKREKETVALREFPMQCPKLLRESYSCYHRRVNETEAEMNRYVEPELEVTLNVEVVQSSDPLEALAVPGPSRYNLCPSFDNTSQDKRTLDVASESIQEVPASKIARKKPFLTPSSLLSILDIKEENTVQDSTLTTEEVLDDFKISSQEEGSGSNISSEDIFLPRFCSKAAESDSDSSVYFKARRIQKPKQKVTTELLFHRYKLKSKREIERLHSKIRELKASVDKYKRRVYRLQQRCGNATAEK